MNYPSISEYIESIRFAEDNFGSLSSLRPVLDDSGNPVMSSGNFAVVFKMTDGNKDYAVKCFTREQEGRAEAYRQICEELEYVSSTFLCTIRYYDRELFVDTNATTETEFPVLLMDWVDGVPLDRFVSDHLNDHYTIGLLCYQFCRMAQWLMTQPFAHGDLKPDNILVQSDGSIVLVDYDGMYVPAMKGQKSREMGSPNYRHPLRSEDQFDEHIDDFALCVIALSLKALSLQPSLFHDFGSSDRLLFSDADYRDLSSSRLVASLQSLMGDSELNRLYALFLLGHSCHALTDVSFRLFGVTKPEKPAPVEVLSTKATDEDLANAREDEYGIKYSRDGKKLLKAPWSTDCCIIRQGTEMVCDDAFHNRYSLESITIPDSVTSIGEGAFSGCKSLKNITIPDSVTSIGRRAFSRCDLDIILESTRYSTDGVCLFDSKRAEIISCFKSSIEEYAIPDSVTSIGEGAFSWCESMKNITIPDSVTRIGDGAFSWCKSLKNITIPDSVTSIGDRAFEDCSHLQSITIPDSVTSIGNYAFCRCKSLKSIIISDSVTRIGEGSFRDCESLKRITIPDSVTSIGCGAFSRCDLDIILESTRYSTDGVCLFDSKRTEIISCFKSSIEEYAIPGSVTRIGSYAFDACSNLQSITIPDSVTSIGDRAFSWCKSLESITIPDSVTRIGDRAFSWCESLESITIPDSVTSIGDDAFWRCTSLQSVSIPNSVTSIEEGVFSGCKSLKSITIPDSVTSIGDDAFYGCEFLQSITIPDSVTSIGDGVFEDCEFLQSIYIPRNTYSKFEELLPDYKDILF